MTNNTYTATLKPTKGYYYDVKYGTKTYKNYPYKVYIAAPHTPKEDEEVLDTYYRTDEKPNLDKLTTALERQGWELTGQWEQIDETSWEMAVVDRRAETVMELAKQIVELAEEPLYGKGSPGLGAFLSEAVTEMRYLVHTGTGWREERQLLAKGAVAMRNGGEITRPGRVVWHDPGHSAGKSEQEWKDSLRYYRVEEQDDRVMLARVATPYDEPGEGATWEVASEVNKKLAEEAGHRRPVAMLEPMNDRTW